MTITVGWPPAWLVSSLLLVAAFFGFLVADKEYMHWYSEDPADRSEVDARLEDIVLAVNDLIEQGRATESGSSTSGNISRLDIMAVEQRVSRLSEVTLAAYIITLVDQGLISAVGAPSLLQRCREWVDSGGDFATGCQ